MSAELDPAKAASNDLLGPVPRWWDCDTHGPGNHTSWGCPECVRALRTLAREQAVEIQTLRDALTEWLAGKSKGNDDGR